MSVITILWSAACGGCLMLALTHLMVWLQHRDRWEYLFLPLTAVAVIGLAAGEYWMLKTTSVEEVGRAGRYCHLFYALGAFSSLGFVHVYFGTGRNWLLLLALGVRLLAVVINFLVGVNLHIYSIETLHRITFLGEEVTVLGTWVENPWVRVGQLASLIHLWYVLDACVRRWRIGGPNSKRRVLVVGGGLTIFIILAASQAGLVAAGVIRGPFLVSFPFLALALAMAFELSRDVVSAAMLSGQLRTSEQRLALAAASASLGVWEWDLKTGHIWISDEGRAILGVEPEEDFSLVRFLKCVHEEDQTRMKRGLDAADAGPDAHTTEFRVIHADGAVRWATTTGRVERDAEGRHLLMRGVVQDITDRKRAEQEAASQRWELAHVSRVSTLGELAGTLAHELNQPLTAMLSNAQVGQTSLQQGSHDDEEMAAILSDIADDAKRAGEIIHGMRAMFKNEPEAAEEPVELGALVQQTLRLLHSEILARRTTVELNFEPGTPRVKGRKVELLQVLINLILNSLDAMKGMTSGARIEVLLKGEDGVVLLAVRDRGTGIDPGMQDRLFEPFASTKAGGLGLGLAVSARIIERCGGRLSAENHPEGGAVFSVLLPALNAEKFACL